MRYNTSLNVDLEAFQDNIQFLKSNYPQKEILFMLKSNAYGHGIIPLAVAAKELSVKSYGLASLAEAVYLRDELFEYDSEIYVFSDLNFKTHFEVYEDKKLIPVIHCESDLEFYFSKKHTLPLVLKFNTGMNRLGLDYEKIEFYIQLLKKNSHNSIYHLMSHFSDANLKPDSNKNKMQIERFNNIKKEFKNANIKLNKKSMENSAALEQGMSLEEHNVIRPGLMLYGPSSLLNNENAKIKWENKYISEFKTHVLSTKNVRKGDPVGYGSTVCPFDGKLSILPIGYGDGFSTQLKGKKIMLNEEMSLVMGRVNMDMIQILRDHSTPILKESQEVYLWDFRGNGVKNLCHQLSSIPYEIFCSLTSRIPRKYCKINR